MPLGPSKAVLVQCYNKADTTALTLSALMKCSHTADFNLVIWQDDETGNPKAATHGPGRVATTAVVEAMLPILQKAFRSVEFRKNEKNLGCYATCKVAIDTVLESNDFVIFTEDDAIFSEDALDWFVAATSLPEFADPNCVAITGESVYFDSQGKAVDRAFRFRMLEAANASNIGLDYIMHNFVTSTVFAVDREKWSLIRDIRGQINGDVTLCHECAKRSWTCIFPMVPRVVDIGMRHSQGYSVGIHSAENVSDKTSYITSDDLVAVRGPFKPYPGSKGRMYNLTANLAESDLPFSAIYEMKD
jgi:hypothetical protein